MWDGLSGELIRGVLLGVNLGGFRRGLEGCVGYWFGLSLVFLIVKYHKNILIVTKIRSHCITITIFQA